MRLILALFLHLLIFPISNGFLASFDAVPLGTIFQRQSVMRIYHSRDNITFKHRCLHVLKESDGASTHQSRDSYLSLRVGIIGAGSIAFGTASLLSSLGHDPMLWSPSGSGTKDLMMHDNLDHRARSTIQSIGALDQIFSARVAKSPKELIVSNDNILVIALPVNGHKQVMEAIAPEIVSYIMDQRIKAKNDISNKSGEGSNPIMHIIISSHASLGAVYLMNLLKQEQHQYACNNNVDFESDDISWVRITSWGTTAVTARKLSGTSVKVLTIREVVDFCTVPSSPSYDPENIVQPESVRAQEDLNSLLSNGYRLCTCLFGQRFKFRKGGLLAISLSNLNPQNHLGIVLGNMSRMDPPPPPPPLNLDTPMPDVILEPWYQGKCITPNVGRLMEALDRERIEIAKALDIEVRTIYQHFSWSFHVPLEVPVDNKASSSYNVAMRPLTVSEMNQQMHYYKGNDVLGPAVADSRYVLEDVPYGLVLTVILGRLLNRAAVLHESGIRILSAMYGRDFMNENELLKGLKLIGNDSNIPRLDRWLDMAYTGYFECDCISKTEIDTDKTSFLKTN